MRKIKPLQKKHRFIKWLKRLLGIKPVLRGDWKDIDEVHTLEDDTIYQALINGMAGKEREK